MTRYAYIKDGIVEEVHHDLPTSWKNVSNFHVLLDSDPKHFRNLGWRVIKKFDESSVDTSKYEMLDPVFNIVDDEVIEHRELREKNVSQ